MSRWLSPRLSDSARGWGFGNPPTSASMAPLPWGRASPILTRRTIVGPLVRPVLPPGPHPWHPGCRAACLLGFDATLVEVKRAFDEPSPPGRVVVPLPFARECRPRRNVGRAGVGRTNLLSDDRSEERR